MIGEALIDLVPVTGGRLFEAVPGGGPANVAVGLARLGVPTRLLARIGRDAFGRRIRAHLLDNGVSLAYAVDAAEPSSLAVVDVGPDGEPAYDFRVAGTADWQWRDAELATVLDDVVALHAGSLAAVLPPGADALRRLMARARRTATVSYDPNCRPEVMGEEEHARRRIRETIALADVVKVSSEDLAWLCPGAIPEEFVRQALSSGAALALVTLGADGVLGATAASGLVHRPARPVTVVDAVGAGDAFMSATLAGLHRWDLLGADRRGELAGAGASVLAGVLDLAVHAAAITCSRRGADPPHARDLPALAGPLPTA